MQLIYDNIVASMVAGVVLLIMVSAQQRNQVAAAEASAYFMLQQQMIDFSSVVQRDMQNASGVIDVAETDSVFRFLSQTDAADTTKRVVTYRREPAGTAVDEEGNTVNVYRIDRYVDGSIAGGSLATISQWSVVALNEDEAAIATPGDAAAIRVMLAALPPVRVGKNEGKSLQGTRWQATFRPQLLRGQEL